MPPARWRSIAGWARADRCAGEPQAGFPHRGRALRALPRGSRASGLLGGPLAPVRNARLGSPMCRSSSAATLTVGVFFAVASGPPVLRHRALAAYGRPTHPPARSTCRTSPASTRSAPAGRQSQIRYYVFALLFVLFDVEAVFIFPGPLRLEDYGVFGLVEMIVFIIVLALGLVYAWRKGCPALDLARVRPPMGLARERQGACEAAHQVAEHRPASTPSGCTSGASRAAPSRWERAFTLPRYDVMRLGVIPLPASPRQSRPPGRRRHGDRQDGPGRSAASTSRCPTRST